MCPITFCLEGQEAIVVLNSLLNSVVIDFEKANVAEDACLTVNLTDAAHNGYLRIVQSGHSAEPFWD